MIATAFGGVNAYAAGTSINRIFSGGVPTIVHERLSEAAGPAGVAAASSGVAAAFDPSRAREPPPQASSRRGPRRPGRRGRRAPRPAPAARDENSATTTPASCSTCTRCPSQPAALKLTWPAASVTQKQLRYEHSSQERAPPSPPRPRTRPCPRCARHRPATRAGTTCRPPAPASRTASARTLRGP